MISSIPLFPFPYIFNGEKFDGSLLSWPEECHRCKADTCKITVMNEPSICSYGFNYQSLKNGIIIGGIVLREYSSQSHARRKKRNAYKDVLISKQLLKNAIQTLEEFSLAALEELEKHKESIIEQYVSDKQYELDFLRNIRPDIMRGLSF